MTRITAALAAGLIAAAGLASPAAAQQSSTSISMNNGEVEGESIKIIGGVEYRIEFDGDGVHSAFIDGDEADFETDDGTVRLTHEGETVEFRMPSVTGQGFAVNRLPGLRAGNVMVDADPPATMVGLVQRPLGDQLREHLGLDEGVGTMVTNVVEGLPADEAGLREGDVLVNVSGREVTGSGVLTDELAELEPGDKIDVTVLRKGLPESLTITVAEFDAERLYGRDLDLPFVPGEANRRGLNWEMEPFEIEMDFDFDEFEEMIRGEIESIEPLNEAQRRELDETMRAAREKVERAIEQAQRARELRINPDWRADLLIRPDKGDERAIIIERDRLGDIDERFGNRHPEVKAKREALEQRAAELRERNTQLEERVEALETKLDRLIELLENQAEDRGEE